MAATFTTAGLDYMLGVFVENDESPDTLYLGLFSGGDGSTCPAADATRGTMGGSFVEADFTAYVAVEVAAAEWGDPATETLDGVTGARVIAAAQKSFAAAGVTLAVDGAATSEWTWTDARVSVEAYEPLTGKPHVIAQGVIRALPEITQ